MSNYEIYKFEDANIRVISSEQGSIEWICLNDVMKYLRRSDMIETGKILKICKSIKRHPFREGGRNRWAIRPHDVHYIVRKVCSDNGMIATRCEKLQNWVASLPMQRPKDGGLLPAIQSEDLVIFNYQDQFPITFKTDSGKTYINATQMARSFGKQPSLWLRQPSVVEYRESMVVRGESESLESQVITTRGYNGTTWIEEGLAIEFARWLSPEFSAWCNSKIKELVEGGQPPMHHYQKQTVSGSRECYIVPQSFDEALQLAADQARKLRESEHKVDFYDEFVEGRNNFKSSRIADELEISVVMLHRFLFENGIVTYERKRKRWVVNGPYRPLQCDATYLWQREDGKVYPFGTVKRWTQAGREYIIELWNEKTGI